MTNFEKYKDDLIKIEGDFAFDKNTKEVVGCNTLDGVERRIDCVDCVFNEGDCFESDKIKWLYSEYTALTDAEINLINTLEEMTGTIYNFIVRDAYDEIYLFSNIPIAKDNRQYKYYLSQNDCLSISDRTKKLFPNIQYKDGIYDITEKCFLEE